MTYWWNCSSDDTPSDDTEGVAFGDPSAENLIGLWDFSNDAKAADTGLADGIAQNGSFSGGAYATSEALRLDGSGDYFTVNGDDEPFELSQGTIMLQFNQTEQVGSSPDTVVSRGEYDRCNEDGFFAIKVTESGAVTVSHYSGDEELFLSTGENFFEPGDEVRVAYTWDENGTGTFVVENVTTGGDYSEDFDSTGLNFDIGEDDQGSFTFGATQTSDCDYDSYFNGHIDYVAVFDTDVVNMGNGIVDGTDGNDLIDIAYLDDPEGDMIDSLDNLAGNNDDIVLAGKGHDTVLAGEGNDEVYGEEGNDTLSGGAGADAIYGGDDADTILGGTDGDHVDGGEGGCDNDTLDLTGAGPLVIHYDAGNPENGTVDFLDGPGGAVIGSMTFENIEHVIPCFTPGTLIATPRGEVTVQDLKIGDKVITRDNGLQAIRWIGRKTLSTAEVMLRKDLSPVLIRQGALGNGLPERDMKVSPNHRMLVASEKAALYFEDHEVLVAAKHLTRMDGVERLEPEAVTYVHVMFDRHEVILSDGTWSESFQPGDYTLDGIGDEQREEIYALFPQLREKSGRDAFSAARRILRKHEAELLVS